MPDPSPLLLKPAAVAALFGVTTRTIRNWQRRNLLTPMRVGRSVFFRRSEVESLAGLFEDPGSAEIVSTTEACFEPYQ